MASCMRQPQPLKLSRGRIALPAGLPAGSCLQLHNCQRALSSPHTAVCEASTWPYVHVAVPARCCPCTLLSLHIAVPARCSPCLPAARLSCGGASSSRACLQADAGPGHALPVVGMLFLLAALPAEGFPALACSRATGPSVLCTQLVALLTLPCPCLQEGFLAEDDMGAHDEYARENDEEEEFRRVRQEAEERNAAARAACEC